ncbi:MAG: hypothetical protein JSR48_01545 [Verrucomicrobia bacterium]|nr:hypothetical protein [Verrucomicrobiota bacterium]
MKNWLLAGGLALAAAGLGRAETPFSQALPPEDFAAAELGKLTPAALARLDELVAAYKRGEVATVRAAAAAEVEAARAAAETEKARARAEAAHAQAEAAKARETSPGLLAKAKVLLSPGTKVEYAAVESCLAGDFDGWEGHTVFRLENGQHWRVANGGSYYSPVLHRPKVSITPASFGGFWMEIEGVSQKVKVLPLDR